MDSYLERLFAQRQAAWERQKEILTRAQDEGRDLTAEETADVEATDVAIDKAAAEEKRYAASLEKAKIAVTAIREDEAKAEVVKTAAASDLVKMFRGEIRGFDAVWTKPDMEMRALQSAGGSAIDQSFYDRVTMYERTLVPVLSVATVLNTPRGEPIALPRLTADPTAGGTLTAENGGITEADPTISSVTLNAYKYAVVNLWSRELDEDNVIGLEDLVARSSARALAIGIGTALTTGDGSDKPNGYITAATNGGTALGTAQGQASDTFVSAFDLVDLFYGLAAPYRTAATWMVSTTAIAKMRKMRDADGQWLWTNAVPGGVPTFLGAPVLENPAMAAVASASKSFAVGDFSRYFVRRLPLRVETSTDYKFSVDQLAIKTVERIDGDLVDTAAIRYIVSANT